MTLRYLLRNLYNWLNWFLASKSRYYGYLLLLAIVYLKVAVL